MNLVSRLNEEDQVLTFNTYEETMWDVAPDLQGVATDNLLW
jgi:hypothetical protein